MILNPEQIRKIRRQLGESQLDFAKRLDVSPVTIARWETGQRVCKGAYALEIMELDINMKVSPTVTESGNMQQPLKKTEDHHFPNNALVFDLVCIKCGYANVHPKICHIQADNDDYDGDVYGYSGRGDYMVIDLDCEHCNGSPGQLVLSNHKGSGFLAIYPRTRIRPKNKPISELWSDK